jgi:hypothetical protein
MKTSTPILTVLLAAGLALASLGACSNGVAKDASYGTVVALKDAAVKTGYKCPEWKQTNLRGAEEGSCRPDGTGAHDQFVTFANEADRDAGVKSTLSWGASPILHWVVLQGPNWLIRSDEDADIVALQKGLGGTIVRPSTK